MRWALFTLIGAPVRDAVGGDKPANGRCRDRHHPRAERGDMPDHGLGYIRKRIRDEGCPNCGRRRLTVDRAWEVREEVEEVSTLYATYAFDPKTASNEPRVIVQDADLIKISISDSGTRQADGGFGQGRRSRSLWVTMKLTVLASSNNC